MSTQDDRIYKEHDRVMETMELKGIGCIYVAGVCAVLNLLYFYIHGTAHDADNVNDVDYATLQ